MNLTKRSICLICLQVSVLWLTILFSLKDSLSFFFSPFSSFRNRGWDSRFPFLGGNMSGSKIAKLYQIYQMNRLYYLGWSPVSTDDWDLFTSWTSCFQCRHMTQYWSRINISALAEQGDFSRQIFQGDFSLIAEFSEWEENDRIWIWPMLECLDCEFNSEVLY